MNLLGYIQVGESTEELSGSTSLAVLPMLQQNFLGRTFGCYKINSDYELRDESIPVNPSYDVLDAKAIYGNSRDIALDLGMARVAFRKVTPSSPIRTYDEDLGLEKLFAKPRGSIVLDEAAA